MGEEAHANCHNAYRERYRGLCRSDDGRSTDWGTLKNFGDGFTAALECSFETPERQSLEIVGTEAALSVERAHTPGSEDTTFTLRHRDGRVEEIVAGGADPYRAMIEHFGPTGRVLYVHFRDVQGTVPCFQECFIGEGNYNAAATMLLLRRSGFSGFLLDDHVPLNKHGIPAIDLIDFDYPAWHTADDTLDQLSPESLHQITILFSDRGLPQGYRFMHGFGSHTYSFINDKDERFWVKFHFKSMQGIKTWTNRATRRCSRAR